MKFTRKQKANVFKNTNAVFSTKILEEKPELSYPSEFADFFEAKFSKHQMFFFLENFTTMAPSLVCRFIIMRNNIAADEQR